MYWQVSQSNCELGLVQTCDTNSNSIDKLSVDWCELSARKLCLRCYVVCVWGGASPFPHLSPLGLIIACLRTDQCQPHSCPLCSYLGTDTLSHLQSTGRILRSHTTADHSTEETWNHLQRYVGFSYVNCVFHMLFRLSPTNRTNTLWERTDKLFL